MKRSWFFIVLAAVMIISIFRLATAPTVPTAMAAQAELALLVSRPEVISALVNANRHDHSSRRNIDKEWVDEYRSPKPNGKISALLASDLSRNLSNEKSQSNGQIEQIMVFDVAGCLVAADQSTHDYDQSDEDKWKRTVGARATKPFPEGRNQDPKGYTDQISQAVIDTRGEIIGGVTLRWCNTRGGCS